MKIALPKFMTIALTIIIYIIFIPMYNSVSSDTIRCNDNLIFCLSWTGICCFAICVILWHKLTNKWFELYTIFFAFLCLFMFGQCMMWAIGIHDAQEIGKNNLFRFGKPATEQGIVQAQLLSIMGIMAINCGVVLGYKERENKIEIQEIACIDKTLKYSALYQVSLIVCCIATPATFYQIIRSYIINSIYGYGATLYNANVVASQNNIIALLRFAYFPSLVGMIIGSHFRARTIRICYANFLLFSLLSAMAGDRGEWLFPLCILIWIHHEFINRINFRKIIVYSVAALVIIRFSVAIRNVRSSGVSISSLFEAAINEENPVASAFFELGRGMQHSAILSERGWKAYPYGNTYLLGLIGMSTERIIFFFIPEYVSLATWYSRDYLGIDYGAGFSIIAEACVNFGPYYGMLMLAFIGVILGRLLFSRSINHEDPLSLFFLIGTTYSVIQAIRNTTLVATKTWFFSTLLIYFVAKILLNYTHRNVIRGER